MWLAVDFQPVEAFLVSTYVQDLINYLEHKSVKYMPLTYDHTKEGI